MKEDKAVVESDELTIKKLSLGPFGTNVYLVICKKTRESMIIDAPAEAETIMQELQGTQPQYILLTHSHMDHIGALEELRSQNLPLAAHAEESLSAPPDTLLQDGDSINCGNVEIKVLHTPGHTTGSLCFKIDKYLLAGDTIFSGGPGKTRSPDALKQIIKSITEKIFVLPDDTRIFPGHGNSTMLKKEKEEYEVFASKPHPADLCGDVVWLLS